MTAIVRTTLVAILIAIATLSIAAPASAYTGRCGKCGTIVDVDYIRYDRDRGAQGAVAGAIIGGLLGNQVGSGSGRDAATVAGAIAGGLIGRKVDRKDRGEGERGLRLNIRMDRGGYRTIEVHGDPRLYKGDRVRVHGDRIELI